MATSQLETKKKGRRSHHSEKTKASLVARVNRMEGQMRAVKRMIAEDAYCDDVLNLIASIQSALSGTSSLLIEQHLKSCVVKQVRSGDSEILDEFMKTLRRQMK